MYISNNDFLTDNYDTNKQPEKTFRQLGKPKQSWTAEELPEPACDFGHQQDVWDSSSHGMKWNDQVLLS